MLPNTELHRGRAVPDLRAGSIPEQPHPADLSVPSSLIRARLQSHEVVLRHPAESDYIASLRSRAAGVFYRMPYPGNAGDSLIQFSTDMLLRDLGIRTTVDPREADVILVPGGNPSMWHDIGAGHWQKLWTRFPRADFMVGPAGFKSGYSDWAGIINQHGGRVSALFARDPDSFATLRESGLRADITLGLAHDPALHLRDSDWVKAHRRAASDDYVLCAFRDDHEADRSCRAPFGLSARMVPYRVYNLLARRQAARARARKLAHACSLQNSLPLICSDASKQRFEVFVETIRAAHAVHTDRLHVMLMAVLLGKKVYAYPTSHGKLEGVYRHSLAGWADVELVTI